MSMQAWLDALGLGQYAQVFEENAVDLEVLPSLTEQDLAGLGVLLGHRKKILKAVQDKLASSDLSLAPIAAGTSDGHRRQLAPADTTPVSGTIGSAEGERRQVTVLFSDLVGSTALSNRLDPEVYRGVMSRYHETAIVAIHRFDGYVQQIQGDGIVAYFGYPIAHEHEADRAIRAGMAIVEGLAKLDAGSYGPLQVRIGIASGMVVVSHILSPEKTAVGETPNMAQRMQTVAQPGEVMVSDRAKALAGGGFDYEDRGTHQLKGIAGDTRVWKVIGQSGATSRFEAATRGQLTPMVGRDQEIELLLERWELARAGEGQVVLLSGEPGIGKSRMLRAFQERLGDRIDATLQFQCSPYHANSAFYPLINQFERDLAFQRDDTVDQKLDRVERRLMNELGRSRQDCSLIARILSIPCDERYGCLEMSPQRQKDDTIQLLVELMSHRAAHQAVVVLFEDAHWADPTTLEALGVLLDRVERLPLFVVITHRPEFQAPWANRAHVSAMALSRLSRAQSANVILRVSQGKALPADLVTQILDKTDGVPLFLEELTKAVIESDMVVEVGDHYDYSGTVSKIAIPATLRDSLTARLDRLIPVKELAQVGAAIGREFSYELLSAVAAMQEPELTKSLDQLVASELVFRRGTQANATYVFKHALVQDAAYDSMLKTKRLQLHEQIANAIQRNFPHQAETEPELLAHHFTEAEQLELAIPYWRKAGELAQQRSALQEAIRHHDRGLDLVHRLPPSATRDRFELDIRSNLGTTWIGFAGWAHPKVREHLDAALGASATHSPDESTLHALFGLWAHRNTTGNSYDSLIHAQRLFNLAERGSNISLRLMGDWAFATTRYFMGDFTQSIHHGERIVAGYDAQRDYYLAHRLNNDPKSAGLVFKAVSQYRMGFVDQAANTAETAIAHSLERAHPFNSCWAMHFLTTQLFVPRGDGARVAELLEQVDRTAVEQRLPYFEHVLTHVGRALQATLSDDHEKITSLLAGVFPRWAAAGMAIDLPQFKALYAKSLAHLGRVDEALTLIEEGLKQIARPSGQERHWLAEVLHIKGKVLMIAGDPAGAQIAFEESLTVAREQQAKSWELRTATSLARLWQGQGKIVEAKNLLAPVYNWFTEGFDTKDLQDAKALLGSLA